MFSASMNSCDTLSSRNENVSCCLGGFPSPPFDLLSLKLAWPVGDLVYLKFEAWHKWCA